MIQSSQRRAHVRVTYRKMAFDFEARGFDKRWRSDSAFISCFWGALSMAFPAGEEFFVDDAEACSHRGARALHRDACSRSHGRLAAKQYPLHREHTTSHRQSFDVRLDERRPCLGREKPFFRVVRAQELLV